MNGRPAVLFMRSAGKEGSGDRDGEGIAGERRGDGALLAIQYTFVTFNPAQFTARRSLTRHGGVLSTMTSGVTQRPHVRSWNALPLSDSETFIIQARSPGHSPRAHNTYITFFLFADIMVEHSWR